LRASSSYSTTLDLPLIIEPKAEFLGKSRLDARLGKLSVDLVLSGTFSSFDYSFARKTRRVARVSIPFASFDESLTCISKRELTACLEIVSV
jgi:hypothetical protein